MRCLPGKPSAPSSPGLSVGELSKEMTRVCCLGAEPPEGCLSPRCLCSGKVLGGYFRCLLL